MSTNTPTIGTLESLRETLKQTMEEKNKFEAKVIEDRTRLETKIAELKNVVSDYTAELQSIGNTLETLQPDTRVEHMSRTHVDYRQIHTENAQPVFTSEEVEELLKGFHKPSAASVINPSDILKKVWNGWVVLFLFFLLVFWAIFSWFANQTTGRSGSDFSVPLPSFVATAEACFLLDKIQDRVQERRGAREDLRSIYEFPKTLNPVTRVAETTVAESDEEVQAETVLEERQSVRLLRLPLRGLFRNLLERRSL